MFSQIELGYPTFPALGLMGKGSQISDRHLPCCCSWFCLLDVDWYYAIGFAGPPAFGERIMKFLSFQDHMSQFFMTNESFHISIHISSIGLFFWKSLLHTCYKIEK